MKKILSVGFIALLCCVLFAISVNAREELDSGECGENLKWTLYDDGELVIEGEGKMWDWDWCTYPWRSNHAIIKNVTVKDGVTSIGDCAFYGCRSLTNIIFPEGITFVGDGAFYECSSLMSVNMPDSVMCIGVQAFGYCTSLASVGISNSVTSIETGAFYGCTSLTSVNIPTSVISIGDSAFYGCSNLKKATVYSAGVNFGKLVFGDNSPDLEIFGYAESTAETYATANNHNFVQLKAMVGDVHYDSLSDAIAAARSGDIVKLISNCEVSDLMIKGSITLDLNGCKLTADYIAAFNGNDIIDSSADKSGLLVVDKNNIVVSTNNVQMPIYTDNGYKFFDVKLQAQVETPTNDGFKILYRPSLGSSAYNSQYFADGSIDNDIKMIVRLAWDYAGVESTIKRSRDFIFADSTIQKAYAAGLPIRLSIYGLSDGEGNCMFENIDVTVIIRSISTGVVMKVKICIYNEK